MAAPPSNYQKWRSVPMGTLLGGQTHQTNLDLNQAETILEDCEEAGSVKKVGDWNTKRLIPQF